jgi:hypothetical protein
VNGATFSTAPDSDQDFIIMNSSQFPTARLSTKRADPRIAPVARPASIKAPPRRPAAQPQARKRPKIEPESITNAAG